MQAGSPSVFTAPAEFAPVSALNNAVYFQKPRIVHISTPDVPLQAPLPSPHADLVVSPSLAARFHAGMLEFGTNVHPSTPSFIRDGRIDEAVVKIEGFVGWSCTYVV
jgi:hypothetical protein